jgi:hypothetical protein
MIGCNDVPSRAATPEKARETTADRPWSAVAIAGASTLPSSDKIPARCNAGPIQYDDRPRPTATP